jgi:hypothetical protein
MAEAEAEFDAAIFFDNDQGYLDDAKAKCPGVSRVKVNGDPGIRNQSLIKPGPLKTLTDSLNGENNTYVSLLLYLNQDAKYDPDAGINEADIQKYNEWASATKGNRILLLDWDQTLTQFDGMELLDEMSRINANYLRSVLVKPRDAAIFYLGGKPRFTMITEWLKDVAKSGVRIGILTNNGGCRDSIFQQIVAEIVPEGSYEMMCARFAPNNGDKGKILATDPRFARLCPQAGGRRKTRRRKSRKSRKHRK